jgi:hypothetical protein
VRPELSISESQPTSAPRAFSAAEAVVKLSVNAKKEAIVRKLFTMG